MIPAMKRSALFFLLLGFPLSALAQPQGPPPTAAEPVQEVVHGVKLVDSYRWLEGDEKGELTDRVAEWTDAQNAYTRKVLEDLPGRKKLEARLRELMTVGSVGSPVFRGDLYFYTERQGDQDQGILYVRDGLANEPRVLIDPNTLDDKGLISLDWFTPSQDGKLLAFGTSRAGDENSTLNLLEVATGTWLADELTGKVGDPDWLPDATGFFYSRLRDVKDPYSRQICFHRLGTHMRADKVLYEQHSTTWGPYATISHDARWLILGYYTSTRSNDLWVANLDHWFRTGELKRVDIMVGEEARGDGPIHGDTLFLTTTLGAPTKRVIAVDLNDPSRERWKEIIPARKDAVLRNLSLARGMLVATYLKDASTRIELFRLDGTPLGPVELPGIGSARISTHFDRTEAFLSFASFNTPRSIYHLDLKTAKRELWRRPKVPVDPDSVDVRQVWYTSKDSTRVSMFVIHKKGLKLDGDNPTLLYGYGGFNISMTPRFSATLFPWFEAGGVYAIANLRGGGEYGDAWHKAGQLSKKQNVFDDFYAAAEWLVTKKYTRSGRLAIAGGSNGGLLTGTAVVQRPDLFRAAISAVPLLDMLRYHRFLMARFWVPEYGTAEKAEQFAFLREYSPYQQVKPGTNYPAVFLTAGENDTRVHPLHARKMAAALQTATASKHPILLWVDREAGHGRGKPLHLRLRETTDQRIFLMWQLGMLPTK